MRFATIAAAIKLGALSGGGSPQPKSLAVSAGATGPLYSIVRMLGGSSTLTLTAATNANLTLSGTTISATSGLGSGVTQTAVVREQLGSIAIEYPVAITASGVMVVTMDYGSGNGLTFAIA